jgi:hypothetical protein
MEIKLRGFNKHDLTDTALAVAEGTNAERNARIKGVGLNPVSVAETL